MTYITQRAREFRGGDSDVGRVLLAAYHDAMLSRNVSGLQIPTPVAVSWSVGGALLLVGLASVLFAAPESVQRSVETSGRAILLERLRESCRGTPLSSHLDKGGKRGVDRCAETDCAPSTAADEDRPRRERPRRIITIAPNSAEIICALGACDLIVGVSTFCVYPPKLRDRPRVGGLFDPDIEKLIALRPDLIVLRGRSETVERLAADQGIPLYFDQTEKLGDVARTVREFGERLGCEKEAEQLVEEFLARMERVRRRVQGEPRPRVLLTVSRQPDRLANLLTTGSGTFLDEMIEIAGGVNVFGHLDMAYPQISPEGIIAHRPDVIIELMPEVRLDAKTERQLSEQWGTLDSVPAVRSSRIHFITDDNALIPSPRYVEIIEKVSRILHPEPGDGA